MTYNTEIYEVLEKIELEKDKLDAALIKFDKEEARKACMDIMTFTIMIYDRLGKKDESRTK